MCICTRALVHLRSSRGVEGPPNVDNMLSSSDLPAREAEEAEAGAQKTTKVFSDVLVRGSIYRVRELVRRSARATFRSSRPTCARRERLGRRPHGGARIGRRPHVGAQKTRAAAGRGGRLGRRPHGGARKIYTQLPINNSLSPSPEPTNFTTEITIFLKGNGQKLCFRYQISRTRVITA